MQKQISFKKAAAAHALNVFFISWIVQGIFSEPLIDLLFAKLESEEVLSFILSPGGNALKTIIWLFSILIGILFSFWTLKKRYSFEKNEKFVGLSVLFFSALVLVKDFLVVLVYGNIAGIEIKISLLGVLINILLAAFLFYWLSRINIKKEKDAIFVFGIIVIIAGLLVGGWLMRQSLQELKQAPQSGSLSPVLSPADEFRGWETYRSEDHNFEIRYPTEWQMTTNQGADWWGVYFSTWRESDYPAIGGLPGNEAKSSIVILEGKDLAEINKNFVDSFDDYSKIITNSEFLFKWYPARKLIYSTEVEGGAYIFEYWVEKGKRVYSLSLSTALISSEEARKEFGETFEKMFSSFKFLD